MKFKKLSVLMPMYNEEVHAAATILRTDEYFTKLDFEYEIIVVDDGSSDSTFDNASNVDAEFVKVIKLEKNRGKGNALREAFTHASGDLIMFLDGDLDIHPKQFEVLFEVMNETKTDIVIGAKRHKDSVLKYPLRRKILSAGYFYIVKYLFGLPLLDTQTGIKLFKKEVLDAVFHKVLVKRYAFDLELLILAHHNGYTIGQAPVVVDFKGRYGRITPLVIFNIFWDTLAIFYRLRIRKYYDKKD